MLCLSSTFFAKIVLDDPLSGITLCSNSVKELWKEMSCLGVGLGPWYVVPGKVKLEAFVWLAWFFQCGFAFFACVGPLFDVLPDLGFEQTGEIWPLTPQLWHYVFRCGHMSPLWWAFLPHLMHLPCSFKAFNFALVPVTCLCEVWLVFLWETFRDILPDLVLRPV